MKSYVVFLFLSLQSFAFADSIDIGSKFFDKPNNACTDYQGSILEQSEDYMIGFALCDKQNIMFLSKKHGSTTQKGTPQKIIIDKVVVRKLTKGERFEALSPYCYLEQNKNKHEIFPAIIRWKNRNTVNAKNGGLIEGWTINLKNKKIEPASKDMLNKITCELEGE